MARVNKNWQYMRGYAWRKTAGHCAYCGKVLDRDKGWHLDHVVPRSKGGRWTESNFVAACPTCNLRKSCMSPQEFKTYLAKRIYKTALRFLKEMDDLGRYLSDENAEVVFDNLDRILDCLETAQPVFYIEQTSNEAD